MSDRILIAENRCAALFVSTVSPDSETAALQCGRPVSIVPPFTRPDTWPKAPRLARRMGYFPDCRTHASSSLQNIRPSSDVHTAFSTVNPQPLNDQNRAPHISQPGPFRWRETGALGMYGRGSRVQAQRGLHARSSRRRWLRLQRSPRSPHRLPLIS